MIKRENFREEADKILDWIDGYFERLRELPVKSCVKPREMYEKIPSEAHSSIEKGVGVAGIGRNNLVRIETDAEQRMIPEKFIRRTSKKKILTKS